MKINKKLIILIISIALFIIGIVPVIYFTYFVGDYTRSDVNLTSRDGTSLSSWLYVPSPAPSAGNPVAGVVVTHGFTSSKVSMQGYSIEFVKRGFVVIAIDYRGHGMSEGYLDEIRYTNESTLVDDMMAAVRYLQDLDYVDNKSIAIMGHSMGGITAIQTAGKYKEINATISIGAILDPSHGEGTVNVSSISNLMIGIGALEELFTVEDSLKFVENYTGITNPQINTLYGNFSIGNATKLVVSPTADHVLEASDKILIEASIEWLENSFYKTVRYEITTTQQFRSIFMIIAFLGVLLGYLPVVAYVRGIFFKSKPLIRDVKTISDEIEVYPVQSKKEKLKILAFYSLFYIAGTAIGFFLHIPLQYLFGSVTPLVMSNLFFAIFVGFAIGIFIVYVVLRKYFEKETKSIPKSLIDLFSRDYKKSILLGIVVFLYLFVFLTILLQIAFLDVLLTVREVGSFLVVIIFLAPYFIVDELLVRQMQAKINIRNKYVDWIVITVIESLAKVAIFIPLLFMNLGFAALMVAILILLLPVIELFSTWLYIYSNRNPLIPAITSCLFLSWVLTILMPYGTQFFSLF